MASLFPSRWMCVLAPWTKSRVLSQLCVCVFRRRVGVEKGFIYEVITSCHYTVTCFLTLCKCACVSFCLVLTTFVTFVLFVQPLHRTFGMLLLRRHVRMGSQWWMSGSSTRYFITYHNCISSTKTC